jgi:hypothetical protein
MKVQRNKRGLVATLFLAAIMGTSAYAFTASNTVAGGAAGDGTTGPGGISGYAVTNVHYNSSDDTNITSVSFDMAPANPSGTTKASLNGGSLQSCVGNLAGTHFTCNVSANAVTITASDELRVVSFG